MLRRKFSFSRIQRPRIAITRASTESQEYASTGELDIVRSLKVSPSIHSVTDNTSKTPKWRVYVVVLWSLANLWALLTYGCRTRWRM